MNDELEDRSGEALRNRQDDERNADRDSHNARRRNGGPIENDVPDEVKKQPAKKRAAKRSTKKK
jgi:hypothetical protein